MKKQSLTKKLVAFLAVPLAFVASSNALAQASSITATKHNLSTSKIAGAAIYSDTQAEICVFCHTPHNALKNAAGAGGTKNTLPLWNHALSTNATYGTYGSITMNAAPAELGASGTVTGGVSDGASATTSHLCLSCHDGTVAINSFNRASSINGTTTMVGTTGGLIGARSTNLGTDLSNDHPINFGYDSTLQTNDGGLKDPASLSGVKLFDGKVQCASCHDPHSSKDVSGKGLVRVSMVGSALCLSCHSK